MTRSRIALSINCKRTELSHSLGQYRPDEEVAIWKDQRDPIRIYRARLLELGIAETSLVAIESAAEELVDRAAEEARNSPPPPLEIAMTDVWADGSSTWRN